MLKAIAIRMSEELLGRLDEHVEALETADRTKVIRLAIKEYLDRNEKANKTNA